MPETSIYKLPYPADGESPDGPTQIKALAERLEALGLVGPAVRVKRQTNQTIPNAAWTSLLFTEEVFDTDAAHSTSENTARLTAPRDGIYYAAGTFDTASNGTGMRIARIVKWLKGSSEPSDGVAELLVPGEVKVEEPAAGNALNLASVPFTMKAGDWITMDLFQNSGGNLDVLGDPKIHIPYFGMAWLRPLPGAVL